MAFLQELLNKGIDENALKLHIEIPGGGRI